MSYLLPSLLTSRTQEGFVAIDANPNGVTLWKEVLVGGVKDNREKEVLNASEGSEMMLHVQYRLLKLSEQKLTAEVWIEPSVSSVNVAAHTPSSLADVYSRVGELLCNSDSHIVEAVRSFDTLHAYLMFQRGSRRRDGRPLTPSSGDAVRSLYTKSGGNSKEFSTPPARIFGASSSNSLLADSLTHNRSFSELYYASPSAGSLYGSSESLIPAGSSLRGKEEFLELVDLTLVFTHSVSLVKRYPTLRDRSGDFAKKTTISSLHNLLSDTLSDHTHGKIPLTPEDFTYLGWVEPENNRNEVRGLSAVIVMCLPFVGSRVRENFR